MKKIKSYAKINASLNVLGKLKNNLHKIETLFFFNYLEKKNVYLNNNQLSKKILICLFPIVPELSKSLNETLFQSNNFEKWPIVDKDLLIENKIKLPVQIHGKLITTIDTTKGYSEEEILKSIYQLDKIKNKMQNKKVTKVINVQDKIINIIIN